MVGPQGSAAAPHQHGVVGMDKLATVRHHVEVRRIIDDCELVNADGMLVVWASRPLGNCSRERVPGVNRFAGLMERAAQKGWRVVLLGAHEDVPPQRTRR